MATSTSNKNHCFLHKIFPMLSPPKKIEEQTSMARIMPRRISPSEVRNCMLVLGEELTIEEVEEGMLGLEGEEEESGGYLKEAFRVYELAGEGLITPRSLCEALGRLGERRTEDECEVMIRRFDVDEDGVLTFEEFEMMMMMEEEGRGSLKMKAGSHVGSQWHSRVCM